MKRARNLSAVAAVVLTGVVLALLWRQHGLEEPNGRRQ